MSRADERLAERVASPSARPTGRRYRCGSCGLIFGSEELNPDFDEDGRRVGWICEGCY